MQRKRPRRTAFLTMATLFTSFNSSFAHEWTNSSKCVTNCSIHAPLCFISLDDKDCLALNLTETARQWRVTLSAKQHHSFGNVKLLPQIQTLEVFGDKTHVHFHPSSFWIAEQLTTLLFVGLDFSNTTLPKLPKTLTTLQITDCVVDKLLVTWLLSLPQLETIVMRDNQLTDATLTLIELSDHEFQSLSSRVIGDMVIEARAEEDEMAACVMERGGSIQRLNGWPVCVINDDELVVARRLLYFPSSNGSDVGYPEGIESNNAYGTPALVMASLALPFMFCLYKIGLYIFFAHTHNRHCSESGASNEIAQMNNTKSVAIEMTLRDTDADRSTENDMTTSPSPIFPPHVHRSQTNQPSYNAEFWVNEELQPWRLDFQRLKMLKCLNLPLTEKRQTLRKQSFTSVMNPREIWLASLAREDANMATVSLEGDTAQTLVVTKFLAPIEDQGSRLSASSNAKDKLKRELKRQATFVHPQVVAFIGVAWSCETHLLAVTEYMVQGDLRQWLHRTASKQSGEWSVLKVQMLLDICRALLYLHSMNPSLMHGNCNSRNVLLEESLRAKLSDFGVDGPDSLTEQELMMYSAVGSGRWISPEALLGCETSTSYPDASDVYSFGILVAEMDSHELPFSDLMQANRSAVPETDILQLIAKGALSPTLSPSCPTSVVKLVSACTNYKPQNRPTSRQVQQDLLRILEDFREFENKTTATISVGAPRIDSPSNLV